MSGSGQLKVDTLQDIVDQLGLCDFQTADTLHSIKNNTAFVRLKEMAAEESDNVTVNRSKLEFLLNCLDNQKFIGEQNPETQKEWQGIIDRTNSEARTWLAPNKAVDGN